MKKATLFILPGIAALLLLATSSHAQKKIIDRTAFTPVSTKAVAFVPFKKTDFAPETASADALVTLPNKKKVKLSDYVATLNRLEGNLAQIGFAKNRVEKTVVASRYKTLVGSTAVTVNTSSLATASSAPKVQNTALTARFINMDPNKLKVTDALERINDVNNAERVANLPNEKFDRTYDLTPPEFQTGDYGIQLVAKYYLKGENDPFALPKDQMNEANISKEMKEGSSFYTAGLNVTVSSTLPELGGLTAYKLESEFTARSSSAKKHSVKARLQIMQQVLLNEVNNAVSGDNFNYKENRSYQVSKLIGAADIFTYGLNLIMPVDFYLTSVGVGADIDVTMKRTGISGSMGPRASQSIIIETSATELLGPIGDLGTPVDAGVGGELRLIEGGFDYGFTAGISQSNRRLVFQNDMMGEVNLDLLRGRLFTYYQYPYFKCDNILLQGLDLSCWETRRVENDLFNTGAAIKFSKKVVDEDKTAYVTW